MSQTASRPHPRITILLVDDEAIVRAGIRALLERSEGLAVVGESGDAREAIDLASELRPDLVLLDIAMHGLSGLDAVAPIKKASPRTKVLMASQHERQEFVVQALRAGADGYLSKSSNPQELAMAIESIQRGESFVSPRVARGLVGTMRGDGVAEAPVGHRLQALTMREREVFQLIALGKANKEIAAMLEISLGTVKKHRENLQRKLDCHSAAEIARLAIHEGLLAP